MQKTIKIKLMPTKEQEQYIVNLSKAYIRAVNTLVAAMVEADRVLTLSSKDVPAKMPSAVKNQAIRDAKSVYRRSKSLKSVPVLKKPVCMNHHVSVIRLEKLSNIRNTARTSRKNEKHLHTWSFYRLALFIEYKATLAGIKVEYVDPKYTSQTCPVCSKRNRAKDRTYQCSCGFRTHRDQVAGMNIMHAPVIDGVA